MPRNPSTVGAHGPVKPFEFYLPKPQKPIPPNILEDNSDNWWGGVMRCMAGAALSLVTVAPVFASNPGAFSAPFLEEEYWQNAVQPAPNLLSWPQQYQYEQNEIVLSFVPDEDYYAAVSTQVVPQIYPQQWSFDQPDLPILVTDEDYWQNPVAPVPASLTWPQQWIFDNQEPGGLYGQPDEDYWVNSVAPVPATLAWPQQWTFDVQEPAGSLFGQPDEDYWRNPVAPVSAYPIPITFSDDSDFVVPPPIQDEDYWFRTLNVSNWNTAFGGGETPAVFSIDEDYWFRTLNVSNWNTAFGGGETPSGFTPDEDFYAPPTSLLDSAIWNISIWMDDGSDLPGYTIDEDYALPLVAPVSSYQVFQPFTANDEVVTPPAGAVVDEDYALPLVAPVSSYRVLQPFTADDEIVPQPAGGLVDEDYWFRTLNVSNWNTAFGGGETPAPTTLDEDFYAPPYWLLDSAIWNVSLWLDDGSDLPGYTIDEDYAAPLVQTVWAVPVPITFSDDSDFVVVPIQDEDYWQNPVAPIPASNKLLFPYLPDPEEIPAGTLFGVPEELYWQNWVAPVVWQPAITTVRDMWSQDEITIPPPAGTQNYINTGWHNFVSQDIGFGIEF